MRFIISALIVMIVFSCTDHPRIQEQGKIIEYYPKANIYYDVDRQTYIQFSIQKGEWEKVKTLPDDVIATLGKKITLPDLAVPVYKNNAQHRLVYSVSLYNTPQDYRQKFIEDSVALAPKKSVFVKPIEDSPVEIKKRKRGLRKLFDKIF